jgi:hypothetical protein
MTADPVLPSAAARPAPLARGCDVVTVPDFVGREAPTFEARTLLFLAAWLEHVGPNPVLPLHLACIGPPPPRVERLAARCGALLSVHAPGGAEQRGVSNKLRGFEVARRTDHLLLIDTDVMVLGDPSPVLDLGYCVALSPEHAPRLFPSDWERIYPELQLPMPTERIVGTFGEPMLPYYNSGVVYIPWDCDLRTLWESDMRRIAAMFAEEGKRRRKGRVKRAQGSDQAGLATAVARLRARGVPIVPLPEGFNVRWHQLYRRSLPVERIVLFHATGLYRRKHGRRRVPGLWDYERRLANNFLRARRRRGRKRGPAVSLRDLAAALADTHRLVGRLRRLYRTYVAHGR